MHKVFLGTACFLFSALLLHAQSPLEKGLQSINRTSAEAIVEFLADDELLEVTPENLRLRKRILNHEIRMKALKGNKKYQNL